MTPSADDRRLIARYTAVCAALVAVLVAAVVYGLFINEAALVAGDAQQPEAATTDLATGGWVAPPDSSTVIGQGVDGVDGDMAFTVEGYEIGATVSADAPVDKTAQGDYVVVNLTVANVGDAPTTFMATFQKLLAASAVYHIDDEATFRLGGGVVELAPGDEADVSLAFDVPAGTVPEAIELHADPVSPGVELPLS